jgi:hypothetical protein
MVVARLMETSGTTSSSDVHGQCCEGVSTCDMQLTVCDEDVESDHDELMPAIINLIETKQAEVQVTWYWV